ncbi:MAG TPA: hypothetical protein DCE31_04180, partial [Lautropia sp.]|nr:hypothetical protein [Lautropia sp.]
AGMPLPYACQAGVCCTCRAKVIEGEVRMTRNYTLQADEIAQGFVLACQAHPVSDEVMLSFDKPCDCLSNQIAFSFFANGSDRRRSIRFAATFNTIKPDGKPASRHL